MDHEDENAVEKKDDDRLAVVGTAPVAVETVQPTQPPLPRSKSNKTKRPATMSPNKKAKKSLKKKDNGDEEEKEKDDHDNGDEDPMIRTTKTKSKKSPQRPKPAKKLSSQKTSRAAKHSSHQVNKANNKMMQNDDGDGDDDEDDDQWTTQHPLIGTSPTETTARTLWNLPIPYHSSVRSTCAAAAASALLSPMPFEAPTMTTTKAASAAPFMSWHHPVTFRLERLTVPVHAFHPPVPHQRQPALFRSHICCKLPKSNKVRTVIGMALDVVSPDLSSSSSSSLAATTTTTMDTKDASASATATAATTTVLSLPPRSALAVVQRRMEAILYSRVLQEWLPFLILTAALEEVLHDYVKKEYKKQQDEQLQQQQQHQLQHEGTTSTATLTDGAVLESNIKCSAGGASPPSYYRKAPTSSQYVLDEAALEALTMDSSTAATVAAAKAATAATSSSSSSSSSSILPPVTFTPSQLVSRIKSGCTLLWKQYEFLQQQQQQTTLECALHLGPGMLVGASASSPTQAVEPLATTLSEAAAATTTTPPMTASMSKNENTNSKRPLPQRSRRSSARAAAAAILTSTARGPLSSTSDPTAPDARTNDDNDHPRNDPTLLWNVIPGGRLATYLRQNLLMSQTHHRGEIMQNDTTIDNTNGNHQRNHPSQPVLSSSAPAGAEEKTNGAARPTITTSTKTEPGNGPEDATGTMIVLNDQTVDQNRVRDTNESLTNADESHKVEKETVPLSSSERLASTMDRAPVEETMSLNSKVEVDDSAANSNNAGIVQSIDGRVSATGGEAEVKRMRGNEHKKEKNNKVTQSAEENEHFDANGMEEGEEEEEEEDGAVDDDKDDESFHPPDKTEDDPDDLDEVGIFVKENLDDLQESIRNSHDNSENVTEKVCEETVEEEEEDDSEFNPLVENPYLAVTPYAILEWFGLKTAKWLTIADVQNAFPPLLYSSTDVSAKKKKKKAKVSDKGIIASDLLSDLDRRVWREIGGGNIVSPLLDNKDASLVLQLATEHEDENVENWETSYFAKTRFSVRLMRDYADRGTEAGPSQEEIARVAAAEQALKDQRTWDTWRFKGIHSGYTIWPSWLTAVEEWRAKQRTNLTDVPPQESFNNDLAMAQSIAAEQMSAIEGGARRITRRGGETSGVFYGNQSNLTQKQLMDAILRLTSQKGFHTAFGLHSAVPDESSDPLRRIRASLGKLVWKRNQLARLEVNLDWTDELVRSSLEQGPLVELPKEQSSNPTANNEKMPDYIKYLQSLHQTELQLRNMILKCLADVPVSLIATAADDRHGSMESMDDADFEDASSINWLSSGHDLLNKQIYRPSSTHNTDERTPCFWYEIIDYCVSIASEESDSTAADKAPIGLAKEPVAVERRMRFRASRITDESGQLKSVEPLLLLTEAQVRAGAAAAKIARRKKEVSSQNPFANQMLTHISLCPLSGNSSATPINAVVVGHDTVTNSNGQIHHKVLLLPGRDSEKQIAVWATCGNREGGSVECTLAGDSSIYLIQQCDYHASSPAFQECQSILNFLKRHPKAGPFMEPVDPIALNVPSYFDVVKNPMDISTLSKNLEAGRYSNIAPGEDGRSPLTRMLNGPFRRDVELIFDNAMLFNPADDWIHQAAASIKKAVLKKIDQASASAEHRLSGRPKVNRSVYVDEDSDVDMYKYESDHDEDYQIESRRNRKRKQPAKSIPKEDAAARAMERALRLQKIVNETTGLHGPLSTLSVNFDPATFSLPEDWTCRHKEIVCGKVDRGKELDDLVAVYRLVEEAESSNLRRSTRSHGYEEGTGASVRQSGTSIEYVPPIGAPSETETLPSNRLEVEIAREKLHEEYFAKVYKQKVSSLQLRTDRNFLDCQCGRFAHNSFPPYLGRVIPASQNNQLVWEIRPQYVVAAVRWVIRGLIRSEHLVEVEPTTADSPLTSGVVLVNHVYYVDDREPYEILDTKELNRRKRADQGPAESSEEEIEMSEYEKLRAARVARNAERLKALGLA